MKTTKLVFFAFLFGLALFLAACQKDDPAAMQPADPDPATDSLSFGLGWTGADNLDEVPAATNFGFGNNNLPASVDLGDHFPPVGNQGQYGTCVAWAVAYNGKTVLDGMDRGLSTGDLASEANQFSPKDLFTAIPDQQKAPDCNGTNFTFALDVLQERGVASMQTVPYTNLGDCSQGSLDPSWTQEASQNRIQYYRKIEPTVQSIKQNLANNIPVIFGARLADNFMTWNSEAVLSSSTTYNNVGQHAYHAMVISGYDDSKGPGGAFRVVNSWSAQWGDRGFIWIDYNYFINEFCTGPDGSRPLFIVANEQGAEDPNNDPNPGPAAAGVDLAPWVYSDRSTFSTSGDPAERNIDLNIFNIGNQSADASANWSIYYIYFNAFDANDYGVLFYDEFNTSVAANTFECPTNYNCVFNLNLPAGSNFASAAWGWESVSRTYYMPNITGFYYLVLIADAGDVFQEGDELNNLFYTSMEPIWFEGGYARGGDAPAQAEFEFRNELQPRPEVVRDNVHHSLVTPGNRNAYTPEEIATLIAREKRSGRLDEQVDAGVQGQPKTVYSN